jgi:hypothetical protein
MTKQHRGIDQNHKESAKSSTVKIFLKSLPCKGICKLILTGISIILTVMVSSSMNIENQENNLSSTLYITIYISFSFSGLLNILIFYARKGFFVKNIDSFSLVIAFLVEYLAISADSEETTLSSVNYCLMMTVIGCLMSSVLMMISSSSMTTFSLSMMSMIQGTWLIHSAYLTCSEKTSYLYFSWHVLAVFCITLVINVIMQLQASTQVKKHMVATHSSVTTTVDTVSCSHNAVDSSLTIPGQKTNYAKDKVLGKSIENLTIDKIVDTKALRSIKI